MRLYEVISGPLAGLKGQMCADQGSTVVLKTVRPGWLYPVYTVVAAERVRACLVPSQAIVTQEVST